MAINAGTVMAYLELDTGKFSSTLNQSNKDLMMFADSSNDISKRMQGIGSAFTGVGSLMSKAITVPLAGIGTAATYMSATFEAQMSRVSAISGATGSDLKQLNDMAMQLGADTSFSSKQAAEGMENLASAGFNVNEIMAAMPGMLDLAASGGIEIADASDIAASTLRGFGLEADQAGHVADVLAKAAAATNAGITDMGYSMKYVAPVAKSMGLNLEEVSAAVGEMANAGIKGEQAGTTLRGALISLADPSKEASKLMKQLGFDAFDSKGKMLPLDQMIGNLKKSLNGLTQEQKAQALSTIFGTSSLSGMMVLVDQGPAKLKELTDEFKNSDGSAKEMAKTMQDNLNGSLEQMGGSLETAGIKIGNVLAPTIRDLANWVTDLTNRFSALNPGTQETIVQVGVFAAAVGPALLVTGQFASALGSIKGLFGGFSAASAIASAAAGTTATSVAGTSAAFTGLLGPAGLTIAALVAVTAGGVALYNHMQKDAIPAVQLFGKETSDCTRKAVQGYMDLDDKATKSLMSLKFNGETVSKETADNMTHTYTEMANQIKQGMDKHYQESVQSMNDFFAKSSALSEEEEQKVLNDMQKSNENQKKTVDDGLKEINAIWDKAAKERRKLTDEENAEISKIREEMGTKAVTSLSDTEVESKVILERMKQQAGNLTALQAAEVAKNSAEQKDKAVKAAEDQYNQTVANIIRQRDETGAMTAEQAKKAIDDATRQRDEAVAKATDMHEQVVNQARLQAGEHANEVEWELGQIKSKWDLFLELWQGRVLNAAQKVKNALAGIGNILSYGTNEVYSGKSIDVSGGPNAEFKAFPAFASGTDSAPGGRALVGENGPEIVDLPAGSKVYPADETQKILKSYQSSISDSIKTAAKDSIDMSNIIDSAFSKAQQRTKDTVEVIKNGFDAWAAKNDDLKNSSVYLSGQLNSQMAEYDGLSTQIDLAKKALNDIIYAYGQNSNEALEYQSKISSLEVEQSKLSGEIDKTKDSLSKVEFNTVLDGFQKTQNMAQSTVSIIQKEYELWVLQNNVVEDSTEDLTVKLDMLKQQQEQVNKEVDGATQVYNEAVITYGFMSEEANQYKEKLVDIQIEQAKTTQQIKETTEALQNQAEYYVDEKGTVRKGTNPAKGQGTAPQIASIIKGIYDDAQSLKDQGVSDADVNQWIKDREKAAGLASYAVGTTYVPRDMVAQIHEGEAIIPKAQNPYAGGAGFGGGDVTQQFIFNTPATPNPSEVARKTKMAWRELGLGLAGAL